MNPILMIKIVDKWRPPRKSGLPPETTKARIVHYTIIQAPQKFSGLTHLGSEASK